MKSLTEIADTLQGYEPQALRADAALAFLAALVEPVRESIRVDIKAALGRVLAADVVSPIDVPAHDNSAMDGYAFAGAQLQGADTTLRVVGTAFAGKAWMGEVAPGQCVKIMTGAIMPAGLDTVVPQELVRADAHSITIAAGTLQLGDNRRFRGKTSKKTSLHSSLANAWRQQIWVCWPAWELRTWRCGANPGWRIFQLAMKF